MVLAGESPINNPLITYQSPIDDSIQTRKRVGQRVGEYNREQWKGTAKMWYWVWQNGNYMFNYVEINVLLIRIDISLYSANVSLWCVWLLCLGSVELIQFIECEADIAV